MASGPSNTRHSTLHSRGQRSTPLHSTPYLLHSAKCPLAWSESPPCSRGEGRADAPPGRSRPRARRLHIESPQRAQRRSIRSLQARSLARVRVQHHRPRLSPPAPSPDECTICAAVARHCPFSEQLPQPAQTTPSPPLRSSIQTSRASSHTQAHQPGKREGINHRQARHSA